MSLPKSRLRDLASAVASETILTSVAVSELLVMGFPEHGCEATIGRLRYRLGALTAASEAMQEELERLRGYAREKDIQASGGLAA